MQKLKASWLASSWSPDTSDTFSSLHSSGLKVTTHRGGEFLGSEVSGGCVLRLRPRSRTPSFYPAPSIPYPLLQRLSIRVFARQIAGPISHLNSERKRKQ
ncbi:MAG: hypothetical protein JWM16_5652 [Verrucomicrobiales bacterium]|nr:hypothetical protein [Verrucomicrobiales bacterium]